MEPTVNSPKKEDRKRNRVLIIIIVLLILGYIPLVWGLLSKGSQNTILVENNNTLEIEKNNVQNELALLQSDFSNLETNNSDMQARIDSQQVKISALQLELESASGDKKKLQRVIAKMKKEAETLRKIMQGFVVKIDSLNTLNQNLTAELGQTRTQLTQVESNLIEVNDEKDALAQQVEIGSVLETEQMTSGAIRVRNSGTQRETNRAKNADMIKTCFSVRENKLAKAGDRDFYVRVISPDGTVVTPGARDTKFEWKAGSGFYTVKHSEKYSKEKMDVCIYFDLEGEIPEGKYLTEVYADGYRIGKTYFELK